jgi:autotransporter-associated beta strand protein
VQATGSVSAVNGGYFAVTNQGAGYLFDPTVTITGPTTAVFGTARVIGLLTFDGGTLKTDAGITSSRAVVLTANGGTIDTNGFDSTFSGVFSNGSGTTGGLTKTGTGTLTLTNADTYRGVTKVLAGTLALNNASLATGNVSVKASGAFTMNAGSGIRMNITPGTSADAFTSDAGAAVTLDGTLTLNFASAVSTDPQEWTLFALGSGSATGFDAINLAGAYSGSLIQVSTGFWETVVNGTTFDFTESSGVLLTHAPEPASLSLILLTATGLLARRRRKA